MTTRHPLATAWLDRVAALAADLPSGTRTELLADLGDHLDVALADVNGPADVESVLTRLGDPVDVVAAARADAGVPTAPPPLVDAPSTTTAAEGVALGLLVLSGVLVPVLGIFTVPLWIAGVIVAAVAGRWTGGEIAGLLTLPVGWALPFLSFLLPLRVSVVECVTDAAGNEVCSGDGGGVSWLALGALLVVVGLLVVWTRWLARRPQGRPRRR